MFWKATVPQTPPPQAKLDFKGLASLTLQSIGILITTSTLIFGIGSRLIGLEANTTAIKNDIADIKNQIYPRREAEAAFAAKDQIYGAKLEALRDKLQNLQDENKSKVR